jgi:hypothetical protein
MMRREATFHEEPQTNAKNAYVCATPLQHRNNLVSRMYITSYNRHVRLLSRPALVVHAYQAYRT